MSEKAEIKKKQAVSGSFKGKCGTDMEERKNRIIHEELKENKMGVMPVNRLLLSMSIPMMISMTVQALYNIVDSIFVARISESALTAVSLAFPLQFLMIAFSGGTAVGTNALLSKSLGEKNQKRVDVSAMNGVLLELIFFGAFILAGLFAAEPFLRSQTQDPEILAYGIQYMRIALCCSLGIFMEMIFERLLQSTGRTMFSMIAQLSGAIFNIIMDPILIFGLLGAPKMGIAGAAVATVMGQHLAAVVALAFNLKKNRDVRFSLKNLKPDGWILRRILSVGLPSTLMQAFGSIMTYGMNRILIGFTSTATAVFGVYFKLNSLIFMPVFGLNNGMIPIVAYNYGAKNPKRMKDTIRLTAIYAIAMMTVGCLIFQIFPSQLLSFFNASDNMKTIGIPALRIISLSFPLAGLSIALVSTFQALGKGIYSMINSFCRQLAVLLPSAYLLSLTGVLDRVWWSYLIAEIISLTITILLYRRISRTIIAKL